MSPFFDWTFTLVDEKVSTIANTVVASTQILSDAPALGQLLDARLKYFLKVKLDQQIIAGTGVGSQMNGLTKAGNYTSFSPTSGETGLDSINRALGVLETNEAVGDVVVLNPWDYRSLQRIKGAVEGAYVFGSPSGANDENVWAVEVLPSNAVSAGNFLALDTTQLGALFLREDASVQLGYTGSQFTQNLVTILAECRAVIGVMRSQAVVYGALTL